MAERKPTLRNLAADHVRMRQRSNNCEAVLDWAEEAWRFLASDFSDSPDYERRQRERIVYFLGQALDEKPVPSSLEAQDR
jgi:predicted metal-dependent peptidase